ncbi:pescadillo-like isoform X2 [Saccostrea echinata]|uniref:pescadillo-like isoform X2 n=1 Tax=Saccostrea echinata TaxID=191078 RepID=UPI002A807E8E|nr:pescadillo-like isoform X2 [Saccostrea echinata]
MGGERKKKYERGEATAFMSRNQAVNKLQLTLADFRRLCILKGIYPHEPKHKKRVNKGSTVPKTYYLVKDINFLAHEPIINKFREFKHFVRRLKKAINKRNKDAEQRIRSNKPKYKVDHIVKERYPSFQDALGDLDDCLSMCFLFGTMPQSARIHMEYINHARKLTVEFMHYIIASRSLRKVFISIKGIYYQAEVMGQPLTWVVPHSLGFQHPEDVDYKVMQTFVELYTTLLGFINYKLYHSLNLHYPPKLELETDAPADESEEKMTEKERFQERLSAFSQSLKSIDEGGGEDEVQLDEFPATETDDPDRVEKAKVEAERVKKLQNLFKGKKFFLNREVPRETLVFIIRSFGGEVSWHKSVAVGATFPESDETITHQIVDRPQTKNQYLSRYYVQPQWVFDSVNANSLVPVEHYFPGATLPPHLSPFVEEEEGDYIPPERQAMINRQLGVQEDSGVEEDEEASEDEENDDEEDQEDEEDEEEEVEEEMEESEEEEVQEKKQGKNKRKLDETPGADNAKKLNMSVEAGAPENINVEQKLQRQTMEERRLAEMMIPKKKKRLYDKIMYAKKKKNQETRKLKEKREAIEEQRKAGSKKKKKV